MKYNDLHDDCYLKLQLVCEQCGHTFYVPVEALGPQVMCPSCNCMNIVSSAVRAGACNPVVSGLESACRERAEQWALKQIAKLDSNS